MTPSGRRGRRLPMAVGLLVWAAIAAAQPNLAVNGVAVPGATTTLVADLTYAPAGDFARALGADAVVDPGTGRVTLTLGAAIVQVALVTEAAAAVQVSPAVLRDGQARPGPAAVWTGSEAFVPVKAVGEAFGGRVAFLTDSGTVAVVLPRPSLTMRLEGRGASERLVFALDAPGRLVSFEHPGTGVLELRFERADPAASPALEGQGFVRATLEAVRGTAEARVQLAPGASPRVWSVPAGSGMEVVVAFGSAPAPAPTVALRGTRWVLDAGHVATETFAGSVEGDLTRAFVDLVAAALGRSDVVVERTRPGPAPVSLAERSAAGVGADGFVSVHLGNLPRGRVRIYVLDDASAVEELDRAIRWNAETEVSRPDTDGLRRAVLLKLLPNLDVGRSWAEALAQRLTGAGWSVESPVGAPLAVLAGAAGRGLLLEVSSDDLRDPAAAATLAHALVEAWAALGGR
jgi:N-acetylmuramoyl-L-alanine amidase